MTAVTDHGVMPAEANAALVFTADGYSDADGNDHVTLALAAARRAVASTASDPWAEKLEERSRLIETANATVRDAKGQPCPEVDEMCRRADDLEAEIAAAPVSDPQALAAQILLALRIEAEGGEVKGGALENRMKAAATWLRACAAPRPSAASLGIGPLADRLRAAEIRWEANADRTDGVKARNEGREVTDEDEAVWSAATLEHKAAIDAVLDCRPRDVAELAIKGEVLDGTPSTRGCCEDVMLDVYLSDALVLAKGLSLTAFDLSVQMHEDVVARLQEQAPMDELPEEYWDTLDAVWNSPAPHVGAIAMKLRLHIRSIIADRLTDDLDDPRHFAAMLAIEDANDLEPLLVYQDALRLAGLRPDIAAARRYDPSSFIADCEAAGVHLYVRHSPADGSRVHLGRAPHVPRRLDLEAIAAGLVPREVDVLEGVLKRRAQA